MKEISNQQCNTITIDQIDASKLFAVSNASGDKWLLIESKNGYSLVGIEYSQIVDGTESYVTQAEGLKRLLAGGSLKGFQFDSYKELAAWILEK